MTKIYNNSKYLPSDSLKVQVSRFKLKKSATNSNIQGRVGNLDPEIIKMLDNLYENNGSKYDDKEDIKELGNNNPQKILLSDKEFGKY